jgi:NAD(P)-dependent dehydrogenase (short-subunit alcohol dehydrogenase family)
MRTGSSLPLFYRAMEITSSVDEGRRIVACRYACDVRRPELEQIADDVRSAGGEVALTAVDLACPDDYAAAVEAAIRAFGRLDVLLDGGAMAVGAWGIRSSV